MQLNPYIAFKGDCEEAINFYKDVLDGEITQFMRFSDAPEGAFQYPDSAKNLVMHCTLVFNDCILLASDNIGDQMKAGNNFSLSINADDEEQALAIFNSLLDGGVAIMPFDAVFWGGKFGMLIDKFGIQWMVSSNDESM